MSHGRLMAMTITLDGVFTDDIFERDRRLIDTGENA